MTSTELQIAVAEKMGWKPDGPWLNFWKKKSVSVRLEFLPPFSTSLDAIQQAAREKFKSDESLVEFEEQLLTVALRKNSSVWNLSAEDWCIAFLETCKEMEKV